MMEDDITCNPLTRAPQLQLGIVLVFLEEASYICNFSAFLARSSLSIKSYLIQKKELQECRLTLLASYKSIIGIILFNLSTTISLRKYPFFTFS